MTDDHEYILEARKEKCLSCKNARHTPPGRCKKLEERRWDGINCSHYDKNQDLIAKMEICFQVAHSKLPECTTCRLQSPCLLHAS